VTLPLAWLLTLAFTVGFLWLLSPILLPFVLALVVAYLFNPLVRAGARAGMGRGAASGLVVGGFVAALVGTFAVLVPVLAEQTLRFANSAPSFAQTALETRILPFLDTHLDMTFDHTAVVDTLTEHGEKLLMASVAVLRRLAFSAASVVDVLSLLLITPLVMFYLLRDWEVLTARLRDLLPRRQLDGIVTISTRVDTALAAFLRGQLTVCAALAVIYGVGLWAVGLQMGLLIGVVTGILSFIPFVGMALGLMAATVVAVIQFQFDSVTPYLLVAGVFAAGQLLESFYLTPKLVGEQLGLHPAWVIFALLAGGHLGGFLGVLIALPLTAILSVLVREGVTYWQASPLYGAPTPSKASKKKA
jgi:predicted PurR-regulated permease PerM